MISKSNCERVIIECTKSYDEFIAYYNNCICMGMVNTDGSVTIDGFGYKIQEGEIYLVNYAFSETPEWQYIGTPQIIVKIILPPFVSHINSNAFLSCENLIEISGDGVKTVGSSSFEDCHRLEKVNFPNLISIGAASFQDCRVLKEVTLLNCKQIEEFAFKRCMSLKAVNAPKLTNCGVKAFAKCYSLNKCRFNSITYLQSETFEDCLNLQKFYAPKIIFGLPNTSEQRSTPHKLFIGCYSLKEIHVGTYIGTLKYFHYNHYNCNLIYTRHIDRTENCSKGEQWDF